MRRREFFKGIIGTVAAVLGAPLAGLLKLTPGSFRGKMLRSGGHADPGRIDTLNLEQWNSVQMNQDMEDAWNNFGMALPRALHGKLEGWWLEANGLLSRHGQTYFATYDSVTGELKHEYIQYRLVNEERGEIQATTMSCTPFVPGDAIRISSRTGEFKGLSRRKV